MSSWILSVCLALCCLRSTVVTLSLIWVKQVKRISCAVTSLSPVAGVRSSRCGPLLVGVGRRSAPLLRSSRSLSFTTRSSSTDSGHSSPLQVFPSSAPPLPEYCTSTYVWVLFITFFCFFCSLFGLTSSSSYQSPLFTSRVGSDLTFNSRTAYWDIREQVDTAAACFTYISLYTMAQKILYLAPTEDFFRKIIQNFSLSHLLSVAARLDQFEIEKKDLHDWVVWWFSQLWQSTENLNYQLTSFCRRALPYGS